MDGIAVLLKDDTLNKEMLSNGEIIVERKIIKWAILLILLC